MIGRRALLAAVVAWGAVARGAEPLPAAPEAGAAAVELTGPPPAAPVAERPPVQTVAGERTNGLGMRFAPVGDFWVSRWETRVQDFGAFARATGSAGADWEWAGFDQSPEHPAVNVTWGEAVAFCVWLTRTEREAGRLEPGWEYRLPTDLEWSAAAGLAGEEGATPAERDLGVAGVYAWGGDWPPPKGAGNFRGEEYTDDLHIAGYDDGYPWTAPVGMFAPNAFGLFDLSGNVGEWTADRFEGERGRRVLRGGSWDDGVLRMSLLLSSRMPEHAQHARNTVGFRVVLAPAAEPGAGPGKSRGKRD
jgi:formylglycine-generating enzyme required for sulfatase activity